ncbi:hypothetical protein JCM3774_006131 [Rhodotorula dairenensis]
MESPTPSLREREDMYDSLPPGPMLALPPGVYTLLPLAERCDDFDLPTEQRWDEHACKRRWDEHAARRVTTAHQDSALADEDEDDDDDNSDEHAGGDEFLTPLFVALPRQGSAVSTTTTQPTPTRRRSSAASSQRPAFSAMTPVTPSSPSQLPPPLAAAAAAAVTDAARKTLSSQPIGFLRPQIVRALIDDNRRLVSMNCRPVWAFSPPIAFPPPAKTPERRRSSVARSRSASTKLTRTDSFPATAAGVDDGNNNGLKLDDVLRGLKAMSVSGPASGAGPYAVAFEDWVNAEGPEARREHMDRIVRGWKAKGLFPECLGGWRDEEYVIYAPGSSRGVPATFRGTQEGNPLPGSNEAFRMERSACSLFGLTTFGVHLTAYVKEQDDKPMRIWVPRRSPNKQTWPSMLDNTVAGGITAGDLPRKSILRECAEEASLDPVFVAQRVRQTNVITYNSRTAEGWLSPEVQYCYDLELPDPETELGAREGVIPTTNAADGEVESFSLMTVDEVVQHMVDGHFKPNCALVLLDFFIRHGLLTAESDTRFLDIVSHLHRPMSFPGPA